MAKLGGICSILAGAIFAISGIAFFYIVGRFDWNSISSINSYFQNASEAEMMWGIVNLGAAVASFLAIAGVLALADRLRPFQEGFVRWTCTLALIGYSILAISDVADYYLVKRLAANFSQIDPSAQSALEATGISPLDPALILRFITLGPWFLTAGWLSIRQGLLPKPLAWLGFVAGIAALGYVMVTVLGFQSLTLITGGLAVIFQPVWLIWTGLVLWRVGGEHEPVEMAT